MGKSYNKDKPKKWEYYQHKDMILKGLKEYIDINFNGRVPIINIYIDSKNVFIRNFSKMYGTLSDTKGRDTGGLYGSLNYIFGLIKYMNRLYKNRFTINIVFEKGKSSNHKNLSKEYKTNRDIRSVVTDFDDEQEINRKEMFKYEYEEFKELMIYNKDINVIDVQYQEGDFIMVGLMFKYKQWFIEKQIPTIDIIVSNDSDFRSLFSLMEDNEGKPIYEQWHILQMVKTPSFKSYNTLYTHEYLKTTIFDKDIWLDDFKNKFDDILQLDENLDKIRDKTGTLLLWKKILQGDASDNIKGVPKVGDKTARKVVSVLWNKLKNKMNTQEIKQVFMTDVLNFSKKLKIVNKFPENINTILNNYKMINLSDYDNVVDMISLNSIEKITKTYENHLKGRYYYKKDNIFIYNYLGKLKEHNMNKIIENTYNNNNLLLGKLELNKVKKEFN